jgi:uroporphyrinogen decarboxylase
MNSRERVIAAINWHRPDRVPVDLNPTRRAYVQLKAHLCLDTPDDPVVMSSMEVIPHPDVLQALGVDIIAVKFPSAPTRGDALPPTRRDEWGLTYQLVSHAGGEYYEVASHPLAGATLADLDRYPWPTVRATEKADALRRAACALHAETDLALMGRFGGPIAETAANLVGMEEWYVRLVIDRAFIRALLDRIGAIMTAQDRLGVEAAGEYLQILKVSGEDLGMQAGPLYSLELFRDVLLPPLLRRWQATRQALRKVNPAGRIMLHSCGSVRAFIPDLIAAGMDILDPVQPGAAGMSAGELRSAFPDLVFHGGIDVQRLLPYGRPADVVRETQRCLRDFQAERGGFIAAPAHNVQADVPPANVIAMIQAVADAGR